MSARPQERPSNEVSISRVTRSGRRLTYCLHVLQQPERARACGAGAKSSADRRPVDPPPVVELHVFEGEGDKKEDITFKYEANFFLFASLEAARPIAHPRHQPPPPQQPPPVLTGMPVSGMAYLDRPVEAGYFIFPDLSVRHEGRYKLSFNLYEQTKREQDLDAESSSEGLSKSTGNESPDSSFDFRMEVKSATFSVWSAKKFPGLKESTALSRAVAEQGCRVRIRRDVRMRRRGDGKPGEYDDSYEEQYARGRNDEPESQTRSRSSSTAGMDPSAPHPNGQPYYQNQPGNNLAFIPGSSASQFAPPPPPPMAHPQHNGPPQHQHAPPPPVPRQYQHAPPPYHPQPTPGHNNYPYDRQYPQSAYPGNGPRDSFEQDSRRASAPYPAAVQREFNPIPWPPRSYSTAQPARPRSPQPQVIPPIKLAPDNRYDRQPSLPSVQSPIAVDPHAYRHPEPARTGSKRGYDSVFRSTASATSQPLYNGQRPSVAHVESTAEEDEEEDSEEYSMAKIQNMSYKRADGNVTSRAIPNKIR